ncbi:hypothetical protein SERLADRAFT_432516 [Serpula lacrymans var. lacrymans S7.9]|uniref:Uncharacterized protein n=1 Tax=Serpula lacrymans var. lacrymans (strain S7.9) TaxID=578457 RepID=F8NFN1_SERL9|nr:uncharacterized protein SERLADRAFT_432516 [Serpula lacrymans var. lacrymans S7.9]EGO30871.1 hypothetical protein SERLADRAFT_432516 [Serpula lacrymans var. lacrymans S7.9]
MMEAAMCWAFPALASLAQSAQSLQNQSGSPHRQQKQKAAEIQQFQNSKALHIQYMRLMRRLFKSKFDVGQDEEFAIHNSAVRSNVLVYNRGDENATGPNREDIHFNMRGDVGFEWNKKIFQYLLKYLKQAKNKWHLPEAPDSYLEDLIIDEFNRVKLYWKAASQFR